MLTCAACDDVSSISAADLAQRLVESSSRRPPPYAGAACVAVGREKLPGRVRALLWDTKTAGGVAPRSALLSGDIVKEEPEDADGILVSVSLSADVKFCFAQTQQRRLLSVLSSRTGFSTLYFSGVDATHFYWMDESSPRLGCGGQRQNAIVLQKRLLRWALNAFARIPLLKNIPMQTFEMAFPALLAYTPREREELAKQAAEMLGRGTVIWYGGTLIRQFSDTASFLVFPLLSSREERYAATLLFALANAHQIAASQLDKVSHAARFLLETYRTQHLAQSRALTLALLTVIPALAAVHPGTVRNAKTMQGISQGYLASLMRADAERLAAFVVNTDANPPPTLKVVLSEMRGLVRRAMCGKRHALCRRESAVHTEGKGEEEDVNVFFSDTTVLKVCSTTLHSTLTVMVDEQLRSLVASSHESAACVRLLEWVPEWWDADTNPLHAGAAAGETELKINAKAAAAALREPLAGDDALLAVIHHTRKHRRGDGVQLTSQTVQAALEEADVRLKRRTFLQLVDILALSDDRESRVDAATHFLQQHHVNASNIQRFTESLSALGYK